MEDGKRKAFFVPCPCCEKMIVLDFCNMRWDAGKPETALYNCQMCGGEISEADRDDMLERGEWKENHGEETLTNALYMKGVPFSTVVRAFKEGFKDRDAMERFVDF